MTALVKVEIDKLLAAGIIRPSLSDWASPVVAVLKPDGTARITVNYKRLNAQTIAGSEPGSWELFAEHDELGRLTPSDWQRAQRADAELGLIFDYLANGTLPADASRASQVRKWSELCRLRSSGTAQLLVRHPSDAPAVQMCIPKLLRDQVLEAFHGSAWAGHQGVRRTLERVRAHA